MNIEQIVNQKVERALGASLIRQIVLETQVEELSKQIEEATNRSVNKVRKT